MKITLILAAAPNDPLRKNDPFMPLSLPLIAGAAASHEYTFVDELAGEEPDYGAPADLVGISVRLTAEKTSYAIAAEYQKRGVPVVLGGPQISSMPHRAAEHADAVAVGEGEVLWPLIVEDFAKGELKKFYVASPVPFDAQGQSLRQVNDYADLSKVPWPERRYYRKGYVFDTVFASRGCAIDCDFCAVPHLFGKAVRLRPIEDVVREIDSLGQFYYLLDDTVFGRPAQYDYYLELYDRLARLPRKRLWTGQCNLDAAADEKGREVIRRAAKCGLVYAAVGMEALNPAIQQKSGTIRKSGARNPEELLGRMKDGIRFMQDEGILVSGWFTMGYEEHTLRDFYDTLDFCLEMRIIPILCPLEALPGTRLHARLSEVGRVNQDRKINVTHPTLSDDDILRTLQDTVHKGFAPKESIKRVAHFARRCHRPDATVRDKIEGGMKKLAFAVNLEIHLKEGIIGLANSQ